MDISDDDLRIYEANGAPAFPENVGTTYVEHDGARIWYARAGTGMPVVLLHGGFGNADNWGYQIPALVDAGFRAIAIDSRGHGRSTRDGYPFTYARMANDVLAVLAAEQIERAALVGWSDGAIVALHLGMHHPEHLTDIFAFGGNMHVDGIKQIATATPLLARMLRRHAHDYARLSPTPHDFAPFRRAVQAMMHAEPRWESHDVARIAVPVAIAHAENEEFVRDEHAAELVRAIPGAAFVQLPGVGHFAPLQRPGIFNAAMLAFLRSF